MDLHTAFAKALKRQRKDKGLSQEAFSDVSSRTYMSELERGLKNPTLDKIAELSSIMGIHPLTLLTDCFLIKENIDIEVICARVSRELESLKKDE
jgi:transcriptional regulator with XRE-family HTH domain